MRVNITLACTETGDRNYTTTKNKRIEEILPTLKENNVAPGNKMNGALQSGKGGNHG